MNRRLTGISVALLAIAAVVAGGSQLRSTTAGGQSDSQGHGNHAAHHHPRGNLGNHHHPITTGEPLAQQHFDEGLTLTYGFDHTAAISSFQAAIALDPACAMCYWGIALALGPNINAPMAPAAAPPALEAIEQAQRLAPQASTAEQAYIQALATRYSADSTADRSTLDRAYAAAMRELSRRYPDDLDAATLFAEALMDLTPWNFWTKDGQPNTYTEEIIATLESVLMRNPRHPGANHYYIHTVEASSTPERAIPSAERLETLAPGAGHLSHMPSHTYWRVGRYHDAARINEHAIHADEGTLGTRNADLGSHAFYELVYYPHNIHFLFAAAQMEGRSALALEAARKLVTQIPEDVYATIPGLEAHRPMPLFALARFGEWEAILAEPQPASQFQYTTGIWHWARGFAYVRQGRLPQAAAELEHLNTIAQTDAMKELKLVTFPTAATLLELAGNVLAGELAVARGEFEAGIASLEAAVAIQDSLPYFEPPSWFYPVRQNLGAVLLAAGRAERAESVYREDLRQYPHNGWSLFGLAESLRAQGKTDEAAEAEQRFTEAWQVADVVLTASRF